MRISIHAPREGCDGKRTMIGRPPTLFQSTHPARGATAGLNDFQQFHERDFNPRTPRGVRPQGGQQLRQLIGISIHAPREGCDPPQAEGRCPRCRYFNPRTPRGVRRASVLRAGGVGYFNPRTPRGVRRPGLPGLRGRVPDFNPRTPRGVRLVHGLRLVATLVFQSTHPARGATANFTKEQRVCLAQFAYLHKGKKAEHTKTNAPMLH